MFPFAHKEAVVWADRTLPFNVNDGAFAPGWLDATLAVLNRLPDGLTAAAAFDAQGVYTYFVNSASRLAIPLNVRGKPDFRWDAAGLVLCPTDHPPRHGGNLWQARGQPRQRFHGPCCGHAHRLFIDPAHRYRWQLDRSSPTFKRLYRQRPIVERVNSLAAAHKLTHPRRCSVAHRNTLMYIVLNLHVLFRWRQQRNDNLKRPLCAAAP